MTTTLKKHPSHEDVRALLDPEVIEERVKSLPTYERRQTIATFAGDTNPITLRALAEFLDAIRGHYTDAHMDRDFTIYREKTYEEKVEAVLSNEASDRYYHPEKFAEYTDEDIRTF